MVAARQGRSINQLETIKLALGFDPVSFGLRDWGRPNLACVALLCSHVAADQGSNSAKALSP